jgi:uncharacterized membrane protein
MEFHRKRDESMSTVKKVSLICSILLIVAIGGYGTYVWFETKEINATTILFLLIGVGFLFQSMTWGELNGKHEREKDEMEKHITLVSSKISYYVLLVLMVGVLFLFEGVTPLNEIENKALVTVIGLAFSIHPIVEFLVSKHLMKESEK